MNAWALVATFAALVAIANEGTGCKDPPAQGKEQMRWAAAKIHDELAKIHAATGYDCNWWQDYLLISAYLESRGDPSACYVGSVCTDTNNTARGLFGMRPDSSFPPDRSAYPGGLLFEPSWSVAAAMSYLARVSSNSGYRGSMRGTDMYAARRAWAYPSIFDDTGLTHERSKAIQEYLPEAAAAVGVPRARLRAQMPAFPVPAGEVLTWARNAME